MCKFGGNFVSRTTTEGQQTTGSTGPVPSGAEGELRRRHRYV